MKERKYVLGALVACLVIVASTLAGLAAAKPGKKEEAFKVAWIYPGPHNDGGWSQAHDAGRLAVQKALGSKVQTTYKENVFSNASVPQIVAGLVRDGYNMIFGTSFGMFELGVNGQLADKYPNVLFEQATGTQLKKNQAEYFGAAEDTIYLSGMAAGAATKKGVIGYVVPYGIPEVVRHLNAFTLGAQATHPGAKVKIVWTNAWFSPPKETAAAKALVAAGVDVIGQNVDSPAAGVYAEKAGVPWVGYVVPFAIPEVIRHTNAFTLGVQKAHPGAKVKIIWTNSWFAPDKEKKAAENLHSAGADVIGQNVDSPAAGQFAQSKGLPWVGYDSNAKKFAPTSWLTAAVYNWGPYYLKQVKGAMNGTWKTGSYYGSMADGFTGIAPFGPKVSAKTKAAIAAKKKAIIAGTFYEFQGPIYDQAGKLRVPKGKRMTLGQILSVDWLVKGIEGSPKG